MTVGFDLYRRLSVRHVPHHLRALAMAYAFAAMDDSGVCTSSGAMVAARAGIDETGAAWRKRRQLRELGLLVVLETGGGRREDASYTAQIVKVLPEALPKRTSAAARRLEELNIRARATQRPRRRDAASAPSAHQEMGNGDWREAPRTSGASHCPECKHGSVADLNGDGTEMRCPVCGHEWEASA
jgi:hypothetical protein